jgi:tellurite resistance protein
MIIYGTTNLTMSGDRGQFYCPRCDTSVAYREKHVRRFFTLYFIPLIPLKIVESYVECGGCKGRFAADALRLSKDDYQRKSRDAFAQTLLRAMVLIMIADGTVDDSELDEVERLFAANAADSRVGRDELVRQVGMATRANVDVTEYLQRIAEHLSEPQKNELIRCCFLVSTVGGELREEQMRQLHEFPAALGIQESRFRDIVEDASAT